MPCFATTGGDTVEQLIEKVQMLIELGWQCIRVGPARGKSVSRIDKRAVPSAQEAANAAGDDPLIFEPRESIAVTAQWLTRLRESVGPAPVLGIDYHHRLSVAEAASFCQRMPTGTLDFLEEPIRDETPEAYESLRSMVDVPFAIGEEFASKWQFLPYIERGITNFARIDVCNVGGLTESMKVAGWAEAHYIDLMPHNPLGPICTAATVHLGAAVANFSWLELRVTPGETGNRYDDAIFPNQLKLQGTGIAVPDTPGIGVEVDVDVARFESVTVGADHSHRAVDRHLLRIEVVAALVGENHQRPIGERELGEHSLDVDDRYLRAALDRAGGGDLKLLALIVGPDVARGLDPHPLGRVLDLLLVEDEADVAMVVERREHEDRDQHPDGARQQDLGPAHDAVMRASGHRPALLDDALANRGLRHGGAQPSCAKISCSAQPAMSSSARAGRKSKQAWARATRSSRSSRSSSLSLRA